jgi:hypothetical protein
VKAARPALNEGRLALAVAALAVALTSGPRLEMELTVPRGQVFLGEIWGVYDIPRYVLLLRQAAAGSWVFDNRLEGPGHTAFVLYTPYLLLGHLLGWTGLPPLALMEVGRWIAFPAALAASWLFIRRALPEGQRAVGYFAAVLAGGLGFLFLFRPQTPIGVVAPLDLAAPSFTVMNSLNMGPHVAIAVACLAVFCWGLLAAADGQWRGLLGALGLGLVASFHGFVVPAALLAGGVFFLWRGRRRQVFAVLAAATLLAVPFGLYELSLSAAFKVDWTRDYAELENLPSLLVSRALLWPLILLGGWLAIRDPERRPGPALALCWAACALAFDLFPPFASTELHRTVEGSPLAFGVLAASGLARLPQRPRAYLLAATAISPILESVLLFAAGPYYPAVYLPEGYLLVAQRLDTARSTRCVIGNDLSMLWVTALSEVCDAQPNLTISGPIVDRLAGADPSTAASLLPQSDDFVVWGPFERRAGRQPSLTVEDVQEGVLLLDTGPG